MVLRLRVASDGTGGYGCIAAELDLVMQKALEAIVRHGDEDEIGGLAAGLEAEAGTGHLDEGRCAPAMAGATGNDSLTVLGADDEGAFLKAGDDGDAGGFGGDVLRYAFVGCTHEFVQDGVCGLDALVEFCDSCCRLR